MLNNKLLDEYYDNTIKSYIIAKRVNVMMNSVIAIEINKITIKYFKRTLIAHRAITCWCN